MQESLTNVARHVRPPAATLSVVTADNKLRIEVTNSMSERDAHTSTRAATIGIGITGMHERAASVGVTVTAGPRLAGNFVVVTRLPLEDNE